MNDWYAVIFDMDGLMLDTERVAQVAWQRAVADYGHTLSKELFLDLVGRSLTDVRDILLRAYGAEFPFDPVYLRKQQYVDEHVAVHGLALKSGLLELLDWIDGLGRPKAVASSTFRAAVMQKLALVGLLDRFDTVVCGDEVPQSKPAPDIFLAAAAGLSVDPARCLVLEDSEAGIRAAHAAGMVPIMVPDVKPPSEETARLAYRVCSSLHEVAALLQG